MRASPFDASHANPWSADFVDLPDLNTRATDAIAAAVQRVRESAKGERTAIGSESILVLGAAGAGKTHLFLRLRRKIGPRALFVHLRPLVGTPMTPRYVLGEIVRQLDYPAEGSFRQLDALVGATLAYLHFDSPSFPRPHLERVRALDERARRDEVEWAVEQLAQRHPEMDDAYAARLLGVPFATSIAARRASLAWLSGQDLEQSQMDRLGVAAGLAEERVARALSTLGLLATPGAPIVLVFDQLENLMDGEGDARVKGYANLVAELFDTVRGVVLVQMALVTEWRQAIEPKLGETQKTRLAGHVEHLALPTPSQRRELVRLWAERLEPPRGPFPAPFGEARLARWCAEVGMTPRMLMSECRQALVEGEEAPSDSRDEADERTHAIAAVWEAHLAAARAALDEAAENRSGAPHERLVGGMACAVRFVPGAMVAAVDARKSIQLRVRKGGREVAFALLHQKHHKTVGAVLDDARQLSAGADVVLFREQAIEFPPGWRQTRAKLAELSRQGVRFELVLRDDAARLLALESLLCAARSGDVEDAAGRALSDGDVGAWVERELDVRVWPIARALDAPVDAEPPAPPPERPAGDARAARASVEACLAQLQIASVDRLVREAVRIRPVTTRAEVLEALAALGGGVRWFGRSIIARRTERP